MAEALLKVVCENLTSLIQRELGLLWGVEKEMEKLSSTLSTIWAVLEDAEEKQLKDKAIENWLRRLKDTAYDIDDVLDECTTEALRLESEGESCRLINKVHTSFLTCYHPENVNFLYKIGKRMKEIRKRLDDIAKDRMQFHLHEGVVARRVEARERRQTCSVLTQPHVYGREDDKEKIVEILVNHVSNYEDISISIYPIIGMGGLGKTTLAQLVFNDERVNKHFDTRIWVCVSEDFDAKRVIKAIIESVGGIASETIDLEPLQRRLREMLNGKRYLLVLDDVWNQDQEKWDRLKYVLACGSKGTSIIVTTRIEKVASIMGTLPPHHLSGLSEDNCWSLFKQRAFGNEAEERPNLVAIGKDMIRKCGGVPLAAKALGSLMRFKREENEWLFVKESEIWNLPQDENSILPALRLSYSDLPLELRQCFAYCAIFPKDSIIRKQNIIDLWMANGFIPSNGKLEPEDIGNEIWNELYWRSFFQDLGKDDYGKILNFKMHDLVHDLAQSMVADECCIMEGDKPANISKGIRHVRLVTNSEGLGTFPKALYKAESLRSLLLSPMSELFFVYSRFDFLRVLVARETRITNLSSSIGKLKHLRYLDLSWTQIKILPESICSLQNLQTLDLYGCPYLQSLPKQMRRLRNLRHLYMHSHEITQMPPRIGQLTCLTWLSFFIVGGRRGFRLGELQGLNLRGELHIKHLERVKNLKDAKEANLIGKQNLCNLYLSWGSNGESESQVNAEDVLEALEPHPNLEQLSITGYKGTDFPLWLRNLVLKNVVRIKLSNCKNCPELPLFGKLPSLKTLDISGMEHVEYIDNESEGGVVRGFLSLETLNIECLRNLKRLSRKEGRELLPHLIRLSISLCDKLTTLPCLPSLKELEVRGCNEVLLSSISNLHSLTSLSVGYNSDVISFPDGILRNLTALQSLRIDHFSRLQVLPTDLASLVALKTLAIERCGELECLPEQELGGLTSLQHLKIRECIKFKSLWEGLQKLTALERLDVSSCPKLVTLPIGLNSLRHLTMMGSESFSSKIGGPWIPTICSKLVVLPEAIQHVPALQSLHISGYSDLASLPDWLGNLTSLQSLRIGYCPKLASLPTSIRSLTKLHTLSIGDCPQLERRCEKERGEDWYKINHIPNVNFYNSDLGENSSPI